MRRPNSSLRRGAASVFTLLIMGVSLLLAITQYRYVFLSMKAEHGHWESVLKEKLTKNVATWIRNDVETGAGRIRYLDQDCNYQSEQEAALHLAFHWVHVTYARQDHWPQTTMYWIEGHGLSIALRRQETP